MKITSTQDIKDKQVLLFEVIRGSQAYGTNTPESDIDKTYIFMSPLEDLLSGNYIDGFKEDNNNVDVYEIGKFINLLRTGNPMVVETLWTPDDCIIYKHPIMDKLISIRDSFISKQMKNSFAGYATSQIAKAQGTNKKMNWEKDKMERKNLLQFIYTNKGQGSQLIEEWLTDNGLKQEYCGLSAIPHMRYTYGLYYDYAQHLQREKVTWKEFLTLRDKSKGFALILTDLYIKNHHKQVKSKDYDEFIKSEVNLKYKGILQDVEKSNDISLCSIPKAIIPLTTIYVNMDEYPNHCKEYKEYQEYLANRNESRYVDVQNANANNTGQKIDSKNLMHLIRLTRMGQEIAEGKGIIIRREDREYLLDIRRGKYSLEDILQQGLDMIKDNDKLFEKSNLPESIEKEFTDRILYQLRKQYYSRKGWLLTEEEAHPEL